MKDWKNGFLNGGRYGLEARRPRNENEREYFEERAAILEFCAGYSRARAEEQAGREMIEARLQGLLPP